MNATQALAIGEFDLEVVRGEVCAQHGTTNKMHATAASLAAFMSSPRRNFLS
jgi:hypothetical protein